MIVLLQRIKGILLSFVLTFSLVSCAVKPQSDTLKYAPLQEDATPIVVDHRSTYVREVTPEESFQAKRISFVGQVALIDALRKQLPGVNIMPADTNVDMTQLVSVHARDMSAGDYLDYLSSITGYEIEFEKGYVAIRSFVRKEWNLALFSSKRNISLQVGKSFSTEQGGGRNTFKGNFDDDEWEIITKGAERILGVAGASKKGEFAPFVQGVRSIGLLSAGGEPDKIEAVDDFIRSVVSKGSKQINIAVQAYEVTLDDKRGAGINWQDLSSINATINGNEAGMVFTSEANTLSDLFKSVIRYESSDVRAEATLKFLSTFGEVELLNQPNVTVRNGAYAYISAGEELTYVGEVELEEENDGDDRTTIKVESIRVGVTLSVAPRVLEDGRVLLEIWPSISSADLSNFIESGAGEGIVLPQVQLQELATEVITESGRPVQLGGFIKRSIAKSLSELPWQEKVTGKILNPLFKSETADLERTELVLTVTPTIVEGV
ncbi:MAG: hypothetical protein R3208_04940 [Ketobacteraceae bacterium]|nr:hypothetical protein [Ketobacteraceae bacterium]